MAGARSSTRSSGATSATDRGRRSVGSVDNRLTFVELIEHETAKLSPEGRDLAERLELLAVALPGGPSTREAQRAQADEAWDLPPLDRNILDRVLLLWERL